MGWCILCRSSSQHLNCLLPSCISSGLVPLVSRFEHIKSHYESDIRQKSRLSIHIHDKCWVRGGKVGSLFFSFKSVPEMYTDILYWTNKKTLQPKKPKKFQILCVCELKVDEHANQVSVSFATLFSFIFSKHLYKSDRCSCCGQSQLNTEPRILMKSRFENCYFRSPLQLMHYKPNSDAFSQITLYTQYSGKNFEVGRNQDLVFCTILNASWYRLVFFLFLSLFCLFWFSF